MDTDHDLDSYAWTPFGKISLPLVHSIRGKSRWSVQGVCPPPPPPPPPPFLRRFCLFAIQIAPEYVVAPPFEENSAGPPPPPPPLKFLDLPLSILHIRQFGFSSQARCEIFPQVDTNLLCMCPGKGGVRSENGRKHMQDSMLVCTELVEQRTVNR